MSFSRWFPESERSTSNGVWLLCLPLSFIVMGPLSGALLSHFDWRMLFVLQGLPAVVLGIVYYLTAASRPQEAAWLSREERDYILAGQQGSPKKASAQDYKSAIFNPQVLLMSAVYAFWLIGATGLFMWIPAIIKTLSGAGVTYTSYVSTLPYIAAMAGLLVTGRVSDKTRYKNRVVATALFGLGAFLLLSVLVQAISALSSGPTLSATSASKPAPSQAACSCWWRASASLPCWQLRSES